jgi:hypothetical protein
MEPIQYTQLATLGGSKSGEAWSALPNAPQVFETETGHVIRPARAAAARLLLRLADVVEPTATAAA